jgi:hypothetical protein
VHIEGSRGVATCDVLLHAVLSVPRALIYIYIYLGGGAYRRTKRSNDMLRVAGCSFECSKSLHIYIYLGGGAYRRTPRSSDMLRVAGCSFECSKSLNVYVYVSRWWCI